MPAQAATVPRPHLHQMSYDSSRLFLETSSSVWLDFRSQKKNVRESSPETPEKGIGDEAWLRGVFRMQSVTYRTSWASLYEREIGCSCPVSCPR